jgi:hypothetical protein
MNFGKYIPTTVLIIFACGFHSIPSASLLPLFWSCAVASYVLYLCSVGLLKYLALALINRVTLVKAFIFSQLEFTHLSEGNNDESARLILGTFVENTCVNHAEHKGARLEDQRAGQVSLR